MLRIPFELKHFFSWIRREFFKLVDFLLFLLLLSPAPLPWVVKLFLYHTDFGQVFYCNQGLFKMCPSTLFYTLYFYPILLDVWIFKTILFSFLDKFVRSFFWFVSFWKMIYDRGKPKILHWVISGYLESKTKVQVFRRPLFYAPLERSKIEATKIETK